jgi:hypothetical protein
VVVCGPDVIAIALLPRKGADMRNPARNLALCLLATLALSPSLWAQADPPLSQALLDRLPEMYRERAKDVKLSEQAQQYYMKASEGDLLAAVASGIARQPDGLAFLVAAAGRESSGPRRKRAGRGRPTNLWASSTTTVARGRP